MGKMGGNGVMWGEMGGMCNRQVGKIVHGPKKVANVKFRKWQNISNKSPFYPFF